MPPSIHPSGEPITWEQEGEPAEADADQLELAVGRVAAVALLVRHWPPLGTRHDFALAAGGFLLRGGLDEELAVRLVGAAARIAGADVSARMRDVRDTARQLADGRAVTGGPRLEELLPADGIKVKVLDVLRRWLRLRVPRAHLTDLGNAERFAAQHRETVRYVYAWRTWLLWTGQRWRRDLGAGVMALAKVTVRTIYAEAAAELDQERREKIAAWAGKSEHEARLRAMLFLAQSEPGIPITPDQLDRDPFLLNCLNGTLELRTLHLRPHRREDHCTKVTAAPYEPESRHPVWDAFLARMLPDERGAFLQRVAGYSLTGDTSERKVFLAHGDTATGKSTFLSSIHNTLGDYAATADFSSFLERRADGPRNDLARLAGARLVVSVEVQEGAKMAEGLVKLLTGGDRVTARFLYGEHFEFTPQFKLILAANDRPRASDQDEAFWSRVLEIPFEVSLPEAERDPEVKKTLTDPEQAGAAILAWAAEGAAAWFASGLGTPPAVRQATAAYRDAMDPLRRVRRRVVRARSGTVGRLS